MFQLLKLDESFDLDSFLNISNYQNEINSNFQQISLLLNQTIDGFLLDSHIERLNQIKGKDESHDESYL